MKKYGILIIAVLLMITTLAPYIWTFAEYGLSADSDQWDHFGSYIGGIFSGLAFLGVVYQLHTTKLDQAKQDFERTFFMMLEHHNNKIHFLIDKKINRNGHDISIVEVLYQELIDYPEGRKDYDIRERAEIGDLRDIYVDVNAYFLNLFRILKFLYEHKEFNIENKYSSLLRSYVPKNLLVVLAYHLHRRNSSYHEYIKYINEFSFFEHMDLFILEAMFISKTSSFRNEDVYRLMNSSNLREFQVLDWQLELFKRLYSENRNVDYEKAKRIMIARFYRTPVEISCVPFNCKENYIRNILFYTLETFNSNAFKGNYDYDKLMVVYKNYIDYLKQERNNPFLQESQ